MRILDYPKDSSIHFEDIDSFIDAEAFDVPSEAITIQMSPKQLMDYVVVWNKCFPEHKQTVETANFEGVKLVVK